MKNQINVENIIKGAQETGCSRISRSLFTTLQPKRRRGFHGKVQPQPHDGKRQIWLISIRAVTWFHTSSCRSSFGLISWLAARLWVRL
jgi:hypothetical protein